MDNRRSWLWRRKSSEKSPGETESSGSASSYSERYSDDQEILRASPNNDSPNHVQSPEVSSNISSTQVHETVKSLNEKLSAALLKISAKEDLVKQHMKVAEEAVSGWEKAETELVALKQQLEAAVQKNSALEDRIGHLDGALKESVRQLRQSREEQEQKVHNVVMKKTRTWELEKLEYENQINELQVHLETAKAEASSSVDHDLRSKLEVTEKENTALKVELLARSEHLQMRTIEKELSNRAAETASKQHLESIKKVAKLEAECCRLRAAARRSSLANNDYKPITNSFCVESLTDSHSDSGERLLGLEKEPSCSDSWASALIAELDQFKNAKVSARNLATSSLEIDLMDDFLEIERLVAMPEANFELGDASNLSLPRNDPVKGEVESVRRQMSELEEKIMNMEREKAELKMALADTKNRLEVSCNKLVVAEDKLVVLQRYLDSTNESKLVATTEVVAVEEKCKELESQLESAQSEIRGLREKVHLVEGNLEKEKTVSAELMARVEYVEGARMVLERQLELANFEVKRLREKVCTLESNVECEKAMSAEFAAKVNIMEATRKALENQLELANSEMSKLCEKLDLLKNEVEEEKTMSAAFTAKVDAAEAARKAMEIQLEWSHLEVEKLHDKIGLLESKVEEERSLSTEFKVKIEVAEAARTGLQSQLESACLEVGQLCDKVSSLEDKIEVEKAFSAQLASKCQNFESDFSKEKRDAKFQHVMGSNGELKITQEKELAVAAGKLADCQKTIASLSQQLNLLASFDDFLLDADESELGRGLPDLIKGGVKKLDTYDSSGNHRQICSS